MATINDVAAHAGVSVATVSRALNGRSTVDPVLAARVRDAVAELGYHPNGTARSLRRQRTVLLALIISDVENPFFTAVARGVEDVALASGYSVVLCNADEDPDKERRYLDVALEERMAGVVLSPTGAATDLESLRRGGTPVVAVDRPLAGVDQVLVDTRRAAAEATQHLLAAGYRRIFGCVSGPAGVRTADDRSDGFQDALRAAGMAPGPVRRAAYRAEGARPATEDLLRTVPDLDALLVANSAQAIGTLDALRAAGRRPGADIGLVAFDDAPWTRLIDPPLTVVAQPAYELGALAARLLLRRIDGAAGEPRTIRTLDARLIERGSSRRQQQTRT